MTHIITIDGPSGSGKGTISTLIARELGFHFLDSGALYRLTALACTNKNIDLGDVSRVAQVAETLDVKFIAGDEGVKIMLEGDDATLAIRKESMGMGASQVAAHPPVREALLARQQAFAQAPGLVADGRDMGSVVFPKAACKIFLTASAEARAERRVKQLEGQGQTNIEKGKILLDIQQRDKQDRERPVAPLLPAKDAVEIDCTDLSIEQVYQQVLELAKSRLGVSLK